MRVLLTGASGFVGRHVAERLLEAGHEVIAASRTAGRAPAGTREIVVGDVDGSTDWSGAFEGVDSIVHLAARVHVMNETSDDPARDFDVTNRQGTVALARAAVDAGVGQFVFLSSVKAIGEETLGEPFRADSVGAPSDPYGLSKARAEDELDALAAESGLDVVIIRTPLVFGDGVGGNFLSLLSLVQRGIPLPLGSIRNRRTFVSVWNLADLIATCVGRAELGTHRVMAGEDVSPSTPELIRLIARALESPARLVPVPPALLRAAGAVLGRGAAISRLTGSLEVRHGSTSPGWNWTPPLPFAEGVARTARWFRTEGRP